MRRSEERTERILEKVKIKEREKRKRRNAILCASLAAGAALVLSVNLVLFVPYTVHDYDLSAYQNSEYYSLMSKIGEMTYSPYTTNNFEQWHLFEKQLNEGDAQDEPSAEQNDAPQTQRYEEVTNNQTADVIEGDLFKRSSDYVYYLSQRPAEWKTVEENGVKRQNYVEAAYILRTYSINHGVTRFVSELAIEPQVLADQGRSDGSAAKGFFDEPQVFHMPDYFTFSSNDELYLSEDLSTVTAILEEVHSSGIFTTIVSIDVSDPAAPREIGRVAASGSSVTSRMKDDTLFLFTRFSISREPDFSRPEEYLPQFGALGNMQPLPMEDIYLPDDANQASYLLVCSIDPDTLAVKDASALFSYRSTVYVSENNIFATREIRKTSELRIPNPIGDAYFKYRYTYTEIYKIGFDGNGAFSPDGSFEVHGFLKDRFSLDEYQNVLRVVTTTDDNCYDSMYTYVTAEGVPDELQKVLDRNKDLERPKCNLYCIDLDDFSVIASIEDFSDPEEHVESVRFAGEKAYVCTAAEVYNPNVVLPEFLDPVFEFDLSDLDNITWTDTGTLPGYSLSLIEFTDGTLLGIGYGENAFTLKIELYRREGNQVNSVAKFELENCAFAGTFKAYFINAEHGLVGLGVRRLREEGEEYLLLRYDGTKFSEVGYKFELAGGSDYYSGSLNRMRACYADGYVLMFCDSRTNVIYIG